MPSQNQDSPEPNLQRTLHELQTLNRLAVAVSSTTDVDAMVGAILGAASDLTGAMHGSLLLSQSEAEEQFTTLLRTAEEEESKMRTVGKHIAGWVLRYGEAVLTNDFLADPRFRALAELDYPVQSVLAVPIRAGRKLLGVLILHRLLGEGSFSDSDLRLLTIVASQSAQVLENARLLRELREENQYLKSEIERRYRFDEIIGRSPAMEAVFRILEKVIPTEARVLIEGESGTGKELVARAIHYNGPRKDRRFVAVDCGALPENLLESELFGHVKGAFTGATESKKGLFQVADGGTLFLDEINNTSPALQAKLLRAIQEGEVRPVGGAQPVKTDVRILCATSRDLQAAVQEGAFREDLLFRLKVVALKLPPLRERKEDIPLLAEHFLAKCVAVHGKSLKGFTRQALACLLRYGWPGNIRELENAIERAVVLAEADATQIDADVLPEEIRGEGAPRTERLATDHSNLAEAVEHLERQMVLEALRKHGGNRSRAAQSLGLSRRGLLNKIERYGLEGEM